MTDSDLTERLRHVTDHANRHQKLAEERRDEPLAFWDVETLASLRCICCDSKTSHVSAYPSIYSAKFGRQIITWCKECGFGMVPGTSFSLEGYYQSEYALSNRRDRDVDPEVYFAEMDSENPPKMLARYIGRARSQIRKIQEYIPEITSMLDVGAGPGYALRVAGAKEKYAIEFDNYSVKFLDYIGAVCLDWDEVSKHRYDAILLSHSLEHFEYSDVVPRLEVLIGRLKPGGVLYIEVPPGGLGWKHYCYQHEPHTLFFTPEALSRLSEKLAANVVFCGPTIKTYDLIKDHEAPIYNGGNGEPFNDPRGRLTLILRKPEDIK